MRSSAIAATLVASVTVLAGCDNIFGTDNYDPPSSTLTGQVVYQGEPVGVRSDGVELELWQPDFELDEKIEVFVDQDGSFSAVLFDGSYEINLLAGSGPWVDNPERIPFDLRGEMTLEIPVVPYYTVQDESIANNNDVVEATFTLGQVETSRAVQYVGLYVSTTVFVDRTNQVVHVERAGDQIDPGAPISLSVALPANIRVGPGPDPRTKVFARIGIKTVGVAEMLFSPVYEIGL
jgi:hypothetical protein